MRAVESSVLKVDATATVVSEPLNQVRYDWAALDVDTAGFYVGWWNVTISGQDEDTPEFLLEMRAHSPLTAEYVSVEEMKNSLSLGGETYADQDISRAVQSASRVVDSMTQRSFGPPVAETRIFTPVSPDYLYIGHVTAITAVSTNGAAWTQGTEYFLDGSDTLRTLSLHAFTVTAQGVSVTASYGYTSVPPEIVEATQIIAVQLLRRVREAPFGVLASALDGPAIRIGRFDPQVDALLSAHTRSSMVQ